MGALIVIMLWLGINIAIELLGGEKPRSKKTSCKKQVVAPVGRNYDFDLFSDIEDSASPYLRKSA
ncbi:MAG: hypothetical protein E7365_03830 [Clostridiales bacterium]|nr:hypothetical protein [Clostridiales bacterium]